MAVVVGMGVAASHGVLIKGGAALQKVKETILLNFTQLNLFN
jgi:cation transport ATPase